MGHTLAEDTRTHSQTIQAAIEKLEQQRAETSRNAWVIELSGSGVVSSEGGWTVAQGLDDDDAALMVTLHRTIDAQLAILNAARGGARDMDENATPDEPSLTLWVLDLARAILG